MPGPRGGEVQTPAPPGAGAPGLAEVDRRAERSPSRQAVLGLIRMARFVPRFRGRDRMLLALLAHVGLAANRSIVRAALWRPTAYEVELDLGSWLQRLAFVSGGYEPDLPDFLRRLWISRGGDGVLVDVGANVGLVAVPAALLLREENPRRPIVVALEPVADNCAALERNIALNHLESEIQVVTVGAGSQDQPAWIHVEGGLGLGQGSGTANILPAANGAGPDGNPISVRAIDSLRAEGVLGETCAVLKLDTDGYDLKALEGATRMLQADRPLVFGEFDAHALAWHGQSASDIRALATRLDYDVFSRNGSGYSFGVLNEADHIQDLLLVPRELRAIVTWCVEASG